ncbi:MAG: hypothetical protein J6C96_08395 [Oscillospiraceae bacterium]|nr:hypothetical protein [Oscillospiraceae bacterium]
MNKHFDLVKKQDFAGHHKNDVLQSPVVFGGCFEECMKYVNCKMQVLLDAAPRRLIFQGLGTAGIVKYILPLFFSEALLLPHSPLAGLLLRLFPLVRRWQERSHAARRREIY